MLWLLENELSAVLLDLLNAFRGGIQARFFGRWADGRHRLIHMSSSCRRKLDWRTVAQHFRSSVQPVQLRRQFLSLPWWRTLHCSISRLDRPWQHMSAHTCVCGAVWHPQSSSSLLIAVHGVVLEAFPADRASTLICTPRFLHQFSLFVFLDRLGGITSATSSLPEEACGLLCALAGVPSLSFSFGWVFSTHWPSTNSQPDSQLQSGLLLGQLLIPSLSPNQHLGNKPSPAMIPTSLAEFGNPCSSIDGRNCRCHEQLYAHSKRKKRMDCELTRSN